MPKVLFLPALQGQFGDWLYYAALMSLVELNARVSYAREIHENKKLSDMIQGRLDDKKRAKDIAQYLVETDERFFNSLVVGLVGGDPQWHPFDVRPRGGRHSLDDIAERDRDAVGYLELRGDEKLFALDGQHRLAGIRRAMESRADLGEERVSVLFVSHRSTPEGLRRTRSLFIALNKKAVAVSKRDIIALDEVDLAAIITRDLVDSHRWFSRGQIDVDRFTSNLPAQASALTTIGNLYDVIGIALPKIMAPEARSELSNAKRVRLNEDRIVHYRKLAESYFSWLSEIDPDLKGVFASRTPAELIARGRDFENPKLLFRPLGLIIVTRVLAELRRARSLSQSFAQLRRVPMVLTAVPFADIVWDSKRHRINVRGLSLSVRLLVYMLGDQPADDRLRTSYANWLGVAVNQLRLPDRLV